jgi:hypothetical protein
MKSINDPFKVAALFAVLGVAVACSSGDSGTDPGTGGKPNTGGSSETGGAATGGKANTGGAATGGAATGGVATGGASTGGTSTGGSSSGGGGATGGKGGGSPSTGGMMSGGGSSGTGGADMTSGNAMPSPGCSKGTARPANGRILVAGDHIYDFPATYDGKTPFPLLIGLHACSNPIDQIEKLTANSTMETNYVRMFPKSAGDCWSYPSEVTGKVYKVFDDLVNNYCIDLNRVFGTGHSSGAQLLQQIVTNAEYAKHFKFRAVAPDAASDYGTPQGPLPVLYTQGIKDSNRGNGDGHEVVASWIKANKCAGMSMSMPYTTAVDACKASTGASVDAGCKQFTGCSATTIWCSHNDPDYSGTYHGWPCFLTKAMAAFFDTYK